VLWDFFRGETLLRYQRCPFYGPVASCITILFDLFRCVSMTTPWLLALQRNRKGGHIRNMDCVYKGSPILIWLVKRPISGKNIRIGLPVWTQSCCPHLSLDWILEGTLDTELYVYGHFGASIQGKMFRFHPSEIWVVNDILNYWGVAPTRTQIWVWLLPTQHLSC
jgi:hypothetical protein